VSMALSCLFSGVTGTLVPIGLKKAGADPATASAILLTTATDVLSIALLLGLAKSLVG
jgi:magnesium transporter